VDSHGGDFAFEILPPWYRTWWFTAICALTPLVLITAVMRARIRNAMNREIELVRMVEARTVDLCRANGDLLRLSSIDPLTGLANRRAFDQALRKECACLNAPGSAVSLLIVDVDHFKALNDSAGHQRGDECLRLVGVELRGLTKRPADVAARYGGEEFALVLPEADSAGAMRFAETVRLAIAALKLEHPASPVARVVTVSVGVATATHEWCLTPDELIAEADRALYEAKSSGRNRVSAGDRRGVVQPRRS
jgi:diguanylate cyclase (GGDEF)-like protein